VSTPSSLHDVMWIKKQQRLLGCGYLQFPGSRISPAIAHPPPNIENNHIPN
jgi:hypothetical protein